mmetsp:Transcript_311/g.688  ORF Transcript_311/g.688 Transcript_311/m.688 type:complete len:645 (+) Transcript_311:134-2068(+)
MSRDRAYSFGYGSEDHPSTNTTRRKMNNGGGPRYHEMTLLCHRVDLFDDFVASGSKAGENSYAEGLVPIRCLGTDRGCACRTPCTFCHTVVEDHDESSDETSVGGEAPADIHPNLAFLFAGKVAPAKKPPLSENKEKEAATNTAISRTLVVDQIFAQNHGLLSDNVEGGVKVKKYHHPPVGRYGFTPPLMELPSFFDEASSYGFTPTLMEQPKFSDKAPASKKNGKTECNGHNDHESKEESSAGLDSFFDDFAVASKTPTNDAPKQRKPKKHNDNDGTVLVFRAPLKTVVKKTITPNNSDWSGKCFCQCRFDNLMKGSTQQNPHDPSVVHDKYWAQRRRLFKKFDEGIQLDAEGWYSVTPEVVADHVASRFADASDQLFRCPTYNSRDARGGRGNLRGAPSPKKTPPKSMVILDAFCGCGGNAIAFAKLPSSAVSLIVCVDLDRSKLRKAAHNASIYGIPPNRILFIEANSVAVMERCYRDGNLIMDPPPRETLSEYPPREIYDDFTIGGIDLLAEYAQHIDAVFIDPPWGGIDYGAMGKDGYDLARDMKIRGCESGCVGFPPTPEVDGVRLLKIAAAATSTRFVAYDLPRNANKRSLAHAALEAGYEGNSKLEEHYLNGRLKTVTAYFGLDFRHLLDLKKYHR